MSNNNQSSVRWILEELEKFELGTSQFYSKTAIINRADRMHKEESISYVKDFAKQMLENKRFVNAEIIYNETFGGNNE